MPIGRTNQRGHIRFMLGFTLFMIDSLYFIFVGYAAIMAHNAPCNLACVQAHELFYDSMFPASVMIAGALIFASLALTISGHNAMNPHDKVEW